MLQLDESGWPSLSGKSFRASPTVVDGYLYIGSTDGTTYAVNAVSGAEVWQHDTSESIGWAAAVVDGAVFVPTEAGISALDKDSGDLIWKTDLPSGTRSAVTVADGSVFVVDGNLRVHALAAQTGKTDWTADYKFNVTVSSPTVQDGLVYVGGAEEVHAFNAADGSDNWVFSFDGPYAPGYWVGSPSVANGTVFVPQFGIYALDAETGDRQWYTEIPNGITATPTVADGTVYVGRDEQVGVHALDVQTGNEKWARKSEGVPFVGGSPTIVEDRVYIQESGQTGSTANGILCFDASSGELRWRRKTERASWGWGSRSSPIVVNGVLYVGGERGVHALTLENPGDSSGSRVDQGTLGHHHVWQSEAATGTTLTGEETSGTKGTPGSLEGRLGEATHRATVSVAGEQYHVLDEIPEEPARRLAFASADDGLIKPLRATDVAIAYAMSQTYGVDSETRLAYTNEMHETFARVESMARAANLLGQLSGVIALSQLSPLASTSKAVELLEDALDWAEITIEDPYHEQFSKIAAMTSTLEWAQNEVPDPGASLASLTDDGINVAAKSFEAAAIAKDIYEVGRSVETVREVIANAESIRTNVKLGSGPGVEDLRTGAYTILASLAVSIATDITSDMAEQQAKVAAIGRASAAFRRPILNELIELERRARNYELGPAGILRMQALKQVDYGIDAAAYAAMHAIYNELGEGPIGTIYSALWNVDTKADRTGEKAEQLEQQTLYCTISIGDTMRRGLMAYDTSLNSVEYGEQEVFEYE